MKKSIAFIALALLISPLAFALDVPVTVIDRDLGIPLEGVRLQIQDSSATASTDAEGKAVIAIPDQSGKCVVKASLPGYRARNATIDASGKAVTIELTMADVIEGKELVVERAAPGKTDAKSGVSVVVDKREMDTTSRIGLVEDAMSTVKTLPGVGYSGSFNSMPSIRGGYPSEMGTALDGFYLTSAWHWGGAYSIFNPNMVSSIKMSHGIFSARYGRAMSGLLEVSTVKPTGEDVRLDFSMSSTSLDMFAQIPIGKHAGIFTGGKVTYLETIQWLYDAMGKTPKLSDTIPKMPYIRDYYLKGYYTPVPELDASISAFIGTDGIGMNASADQGTYGQSVNMDYGYTQGFVGGNVKWMPTDTLAFRLVGAYNSNVIDITMDTDCYGTIDYSQAFIDEHPELAGNTGYSIDSLDTSLASSQTISQGQAKLETDFQLSQAHAITVGAEGVLQYLTSRQTSNTWIEIPNGTGVTLMPITLTLDRDGTRVINSSAFAMWNFGSENSPISGELGVRGEHYYLWTKDFNISTVPVVDPRLSLRWTPIKDGKGVENLTLSAGAGLFSMFQQNSAAADSGTGAEQSKFTPDRAAFQVIGADVGITDGWHFQIEGFCKEYFNRLYIVSDNSASPATLSIHNDGTGLAAGFDLMLQKKDGRFIDGYLTYSFVYAKYLNPTAPKYEGQTSASGDLLGTWYYPSFHRFHTLNLILNVKPTTGCKFTLKASLASGTPKAQAGGVSAYPVTLPDGTVVQWYSQKSAYSDSLRGDFEIPIDVRYAQYGYFKRTTIRWELYVGVENVLASVYQPKGSTSVNGFTGEQSASAVSFNVGVPIPSVGFKISY